MNERNLGRAEATMKAVDFFPKYLFKCLDIFFKIVGWFLVVVGLRYVGSVSDSQTLRYFAMFVFILYFLSLFIFTLFLLVGGTKENLGLPHGRLGTVILYCLRGFSVAMLWVLSTPPLMDGMIDSLIKLRFVK